MFQILLLQELQAKSPKNVKVNLPPGCGETNTAILYKGKFNGNDAGYVISVTFDDNYKDDVAITQRLKDPKHKVTFSNPDQEAGKDILCTVMWGTGFLIYDDTVELQTDVFTAKGTAINQNSQPTGKECTNTSTDCDYNLGDSVQSQKRTFLLNFDDDQVVIARIKKLSGDILDEKGQPKITLINSAELEIDNSEFYISNQQKDSGRFKTTSNDEFILGFFPFGEFTFTATGDNLDEVEGKCLKCPENDCFVVDLPVKNGVMGDECLVVVIEVEGEGKTVKFDYTYEVKSSSSRKVQGESIAFNPVVGSITAKAGNYLYSYGEFKKRSSLSTGAIVGIVIGVLVGVSLITVGIWYFLKKRGDAKAEEA